MRTGQDGIDLIKHFEGLRLEAYQDSVGVWTIGYGSTKDIKEGMRITPFMAEQFLRDDLEEAEKAVSRLVDVSLTQNEFDALVSFAFNLGAGNLQHSTLLRKLNNSDKVGASDEFLRWVNAGGKKLEGLVRRRKAERALFKDENWKGF